MADTHTPQQRHANMAAIRSKDTMPEMIVRRGLWKRGFRYRLNHKRLPGHPDLVLRKYRTCIFVNGCFWHGHNTDMASLESSECCKIPKSNHDFWVSKIQWNKERDREEQQALASMGWHCIIVWECELKPPKREELLDSIAFTLNHIWLQDHHTKVVHYPSMDEEYMQIPMAAEKRWVNCDYYFNLIEPTYAEQKKYVTVKSIEDCESCSFLYDSCCAVKKHGYYGEEITIEHGGQQYHLCKTESFNQQIERKKQEEVLFALMREKVERELREERYARTTHLPSHHSPAPEVNIPVSERSCFNCACNLAWDNRDGLASCGIYMSLGIPKRNNPTSGKTCRRWAKK